MGGRRGGGDSLLERERQCLRDSEDDDGDNHSSRWGWEYRAVQD